jgi:hypothetical protein
MLIPDINPAKAVGSAIIFHFKEARLAKIKGTVKGGITIYILITFIVFAIMLSNVYMPIDPLSQFTNIATHYIIPLAFLMDWFLTEHTKQYQWTYLGYWLIYPLLYLVFLVSHGLLTQDYLYYFLDINELGVGWFFLVVVILLAVYLVFGALFVFGNRLLNKKLQTIDEEEQSDKTEDSKLPARNIIRRSAPTKGNTIDTIT